LSVTSYEEEKPYAKGYMIQYIVNRFSALYLYMQIGHIKHPV